MLSLKEYKKALGKELCEELTEEQIVKLKDNQEQMAKVFFQIWLEEKS